MPDEIPVSADIGSIVERPDAPSWMDPKIQPDLTLGSEFGTGAMAGTIKGRLTIPDGASFDVRVKHVSSKVDATNQEAILGLVDEHRQLNRLRTTHHSQFPDSPSPFPYSRLDYRGGRVALIIEAMPENSSLFGIQGDGDVGATLNHEELLSSEPDRLTKILAHEFEAVAAGNSAGVSLGQIDKGSIFYLPEQDDRVVVVGGMAAGGTSEDLKAGVVRGVDLLTNGELAGFWSAGEREAARELRQVLSDPNSTIAPESFVAMITDMEQVLEGEEEPAVEAEEGSREQLGEMPAFNESKRLEGLFEGVPIDVLKGKTGSKDFRRKKDYVGVAGEEGHYAAMHKKQAEKRARQEREEARAQERGDRPNFFGQPEPEDMESTFDKPPIMSLVQSLYSLERDQGPRLREMGITEGEIRGYAEKLVRLAQLSQTGGISERFAREVYEETMDLIGKGIITGDLPVELTRLGRYPRPEASPIRDLPTALPSPGQTSQEAPPRAASDITPPGGFDDTAAQERPGSPLTEAVELEEPILTPEQEAKFAARYWRQFNSLEAYQERNKMRFLIPPAAHEGTIVAHIGDPRNIRELEYQSALREVAREMGYEIGQFKQEYEFGYPWSVAPIRQIPKDDDLYEFDNIDDFVGGDDDEFSDEDDEIVPPSPPSSALFEGSEE